MTAAAAPLVRPSLTKQTLPAWAFGLLGVVVILVSLGLFASTGFQGNADFVVFAGLLYLVASTVLSFAVEGGRSARDRLATTLIWTSFVIALLPLVAVLVYTIQQGSHRFDSTFFTHSTFNIANSDPGGGAYHAIIGTIEQVAIASIIAVPLGVLVATYLVEYGGNGWLSKAISFFVDVLTGLPSIVAGLFVYALWILALKQEYSGFAGSLALVVVMLPIVTRTSEEMLRLVPAQLREASYALGVPQWRTILKVVYPTALPGMVTGTLLAVARAVGETAPVLLLVFVSQKINTDPFSGPQESLSVFTFQNAALPNQTAIDRAWTAGLTLIIIVLVLSLLARLVTRRNRLAR